MAHEILKLLLFAIVHDIVFMQELFGCHTAPIRYGNAKASKSILEQHYLCDRDRGQLDAYEVSRT